MMNYSQQIYGPGRFAYPSGDDDDGGGGGGDDDGDSEATPSF